MENLFFLYSATKKRYLSVNFAKFFRTATLKNIFDWLPLFNPCFK